MICSSLSGFIFYHYIGLLKKVQGDLSLFSPVFDRALR